MKKSDKKPPKYKSLLLDKKPKKSIREFTNDLRAVLENFGSTWMGGAFGGAHSYPGPEPGRVHSQGIRYNSSAAKDKKAGSGQKDSREPKRAGRERKWRRKL
jgi:hypothetical protein